MSAWSDGTIRDKYAHTKADGAKETWPEIAHRVPFHVFAAAASRMPSTVKEALQAKAERFIAAKKFMPGGRYLYATGRPFHQTQNCVLFGVEDSREGWADLMHRSTMALMTGAGIGVVYSKVRPEGMAIAKTGGTATGPLALCQMVNEAGRFVMQGGSRRSAIWAGLHWSHPDALKFGTAKDWPESIRSLKRENFLASAPLDGTNISVILDDDFFQAYADPAHLSWEPFTQKWVPSHVLAHKIYWQTVRHMLETGEPGFSIDVGMNAGEHYRNACTEVSSSDDNDICNLGSINMANIDSLEEFAEVMEVAVAFLLAGTLYSDVPFDRIAETRTKNRRLGLGLMGIHEWLLKRGKRYAPDADLQKYLEIYATSTEVAARIADAWDISRPVKTRAIAPNGTIGIAADTTTSAEPLFCVAYKRRYVVGGKEYRYQYVVDGCARRLIESGIPKEAIEDTYTLAADVERRVAFQAWLQQFVDHGISSTINLPAWGTPLNNEDRVRAFGEMLFRYLPRLRGITCYPDGARDGQPLTPVDYDMAMAFEGQVLVEQMDVCDLTRGGGCG